MTEITSDMFTEEVMERYPETVHVFLRQRLQCIGCPISHIHTIADCARENDLDLADLLAELNAALSKASAT